MSFSSPTIKEFKRQDKGITGSWKVMAEPLYEIDKTRVLFLVSQSH